MSQGAAAVQAGTAFLRADEAGIGAAHGAALSFAGFTSAATRRLDTEDIGVQFSGRYARGLYDDDDFTTQPASRCPSDIRKFIT